MIYFVRHGLSEANAKKIFAGQRDDSALVEEGRIQAKETAQKIKDEGLEIHKIITSPSRRARETAEIIASELGFGIQEVVVDKRIHEYDMGSLSGKPWGVISSSMLVNAEEAEDPKVFRERLYSCIKELAKHPENILIVSHGGVGRMLQTIKEDKDTNLFYDLPLAPNASITKIDWVK
jgi:broad specificity phosphatase PhoE